MTIIQNSVSPRRLSVSPRTRPQGSVASYLRVYRGGVPEETAGTQGDYVYRLYSSTNVWVDLEYQPADLNISILSGEVESVEDGLVTVSDVESTVTLRASWRGFPARGYNFSSKSHSTAPRKVWESWREGSLAKHSSDEVDALMAGGGDKEIYTTQNHAAGIYVRNPNCWAAGTNLTCASPWNSRGGRLRAGTAVSPDCIVLASHYGLLVGDVVRFVTLDNTVVERAIISRLKIGTSDMLIARLDSPLPDSITPAKLLPAAIADYLPSLNYSMPIGVPCVVLDQEEKALCSEVSNIGGVSVGFRAPSDPTRSQYYEEIIDGDSGNPSFFAGAEVSYLVGAWQYSASAPFADFERVSGAIATLGGIAPELANLSSFPTYS